ncbi:MAG TPA: hypothetical protein VFZ73_10840 [Gemmatimonadaceae bacterium]
MHRTQKLALTFAASIAAVVSLGCARDYDEDADTLAVGGDVAVPTFGDSAETRVGQIMENPAQYLGDTVTVVADVEEVLGTYAFMLDEDDALAGGIDNDMIVFSPKSAQLANIDDQWLNNRVRVTGVIRQGAAVEIEREIDWDLTPEIEKRFEGPKPVLIAHRVERVNR